MANESVNIQNFLGVRKGMHHSSIFLPLQQILWDLQTGGCSGKSTNQPTTANTIASGQAPTSVLLEKHSSRDDELWGSQASSHISYFTIQHIVSPVLLLKWEGMKQMECEMRRGKDSLFPVAAESCPEIFSLALHHRCYTAMARELPGTPERSLSLMRHLKTAMRRGTKC